MKNLRRTSRRHQAANSEIYYEFPPGARVMTAEGILGVVIDVEDGPHPGSEQYIVELDNDLGGGEYSSSELTSPESTLASLDKEGEVSPSGIIYDLVESEYLGFCPDCGDPRWKSLAHEHTSTPVMVMPARAASIPGTLARAASMLAQADLTLEGNVETGYVASVDYPELAEILIERPPLAHSTTSSLQTQAGMWDRILEPVAERMLQRQEESGYGSYNAETGAAYSVDWCRFRHHRRCFFPKQLDEKGSDQAGYAVYIPEDRGLCPRDKWEDQKACPAPSEPGPKSGERNWKWETYKSWADGGQGRYGSKSLTPLGMPGMPIDAAKVNQSVEDMSKKEPIKDPEQVEYAQTLNEIVQERKQEKQNPYSGANPYMSSMGRWYHASPYDLTGYLLPPAQTGVEPNWDDMDESESGLVFLVDSVENAQGWGSEIAGMSGRGFHVYEVDPEGLTATGPPGMGTATRARIIRKVLSYDPDTDSIVSHASRGANPYMSALQDGEFGFHVTATWKDVQAKAKRIREGGYVRIISASPEYLVGEVQGDKNIYQATLMREPGTKKVAMWECGCAWASYSWGRSGRWKKYEGRLCSHALALNYEGQSRGWSGKDTKEDRHAPSWRVDQQVKVPGDYQRPQVGEWKTSRRTAGLITDAALHYASIPGGFDSIEAAAEWMHAEAVKYESRVTPVLSRSAKEANGEMQGLAHKFKTLDSLVRKLKSKNVEPSQITEPFRIIKDALRYTIALPVPDWGNSVQEALWEIQSAGFRITEEENTWARGDSYSGLHYNLQPNGSDLIFEVQFHTTASFTLKDQVLHRMYEEFRDKSTPLARRQFLWDEMTKHWDDIPIPDHALDFAGETHFLRPVASLEAGTARAVSIEASLHGAPIREMVRDMRAEGVTAQSIASALDFLGVLDSSEVTASVKEAGHVKPFKGLVRGTITDVLDLLEGGMVETGVGIVRASDVLYPTYHPTRGLTASKTADMAEIIGEGWEDVTEESEADRFASGGIERIDIGEGRKHEWGRIPAYYSEEVVFSRAGSVEDQFAFENPSLGEGCDVCGDSGHSTDDHSGDPASYDDATRVAARSFAQPSDQSAERNPGQSGDRVCGNCGEQIFYSVDMSKGSRWIHESNWIATCQKKTEASLAELKDEPEAALPETTAEESDDLDSGDDKMLDGVEDFVPGDARLAHLMVGTPTKGSDDMKIAEAARAHLLQDPEIRKSALKAFTPAEQKQIIDEGEDAGVVAANLASLDITGTHYAPLEAAFQEAETEGALGDDESWLY